MKEPLNSFAERLIRNGELREFLIGLTEKGYTFDTLRKNIDEAEYFVNNEQKYSPFSDPPELHESVARRVKHDGMAFCFPDFNREVSKRSS